MRTTLHFKSFADSPRTLRKMLRRVGYDESLDTTHIVFQPNENRKKENKQYEGYKTSYDAVSQMWIHVKVEIMPVPIKEPPNQMVRA